MRKSLFVSLAIQNIKKNYRTVIPYIFTCVVTIMMYSILMSLTFSPFILEGFGGATVATFLSLGLGVVVVFSFIFIFYTSSFLLKKRLKEFGIYNVLGLEKKHISMIVGIETIITSVISLILGLLFGVLFSKLAQLFLFQLIQIDPTREFTISLTAIVTTIGLYSCVFLAVLLNTIWIVMRSKPIELIRQESAGEKEPKANWLVALMGFITLGAAYYISQTITDPVAAIMYFFIAVILVIIGTFCLFTSGSVVILKALRKNKNFYYKTKNFTSISGMIYRMKRNAAGLANICLLSTCVLVMLSTTVSLYFSMDDLLSARFKRNVIVTGIGTDEATVIETDRIVNDVKNEYKVAPLNSVQYRNTFAAFLINGNSFDLIKDNPSGYLNIIPVSDFNRFSGSNYTLNDDEVIVIYGKNNYEYDEINILGEKYSIKEQVKNNDSIEDYSYYTYTVVTVLVNDYYHLNNLVRDSGYVNERYTYMFNLDAPAETQINVIDSIYQDIKSSELMSGMAEGQETSRGNFMQLYGSFLFIGIFLGALFLMATVLIIYYKQLSEGYEDAKRFDIMKKVGMSQKEVSSSIRRQVLMVFFIPIIMAVIHIGFAFNMIKRVLFVLNMHNDQLFIICTIGTIVIFTLVYGIVYALTSRTYNKIVNSKY